MNRQSNSIMNGKATNPGKPGKTSVSYPAGKTVSSGKSGNKQAPQVNGPLRGGSVFKMKSGKPSNQTRMVNPQLLWKLESKGLGQGQLDTPVDIAFIPGGIMAVSEFENGRIQLFDAMHGRPVRIITESGMKPKGIALDKNTSPGRLAVIDSTSKLIKIFDVESGKIVDTWGEGMYGSPSDIVWDIGTNRYIISDLDPTYPKITILDHDGSVVKRFGDRSPGDNSILSPNYVATDIESRIIVSDYEAHSVKIFNENGNLLDKFGSHGSGPGEMKFPNGVVCDNNGYIMIADNGNHRVSLYSPNGKYIQDLFTDDDSIYWPEGLGVSDGGVLAVTENGIDTNCVKVFQV